MKVGLETVVSYFPETVMKREDFSYLDPVIPKGMERIFRGPDEFRRLRDSNAVEIMGEKVAEKALKCAGLKPSDVDFIIAGNLGGKYVIPMVGTWVHHQLGFLQETPVLNTQNCCAGFVDACNVAWNLIRGGEYKRVLVVMVTAWDTRGGGLATDQTTPMGKLFGDGAGAAVVSSQNLKCEFLSYDNRTFGELYHHMASELRPPEHPELLPEYANQVRMGSYLWADQWFVEWQQRDGKGFAIEGIKTALKKANLSLQDLNLVIIHQAQDVIHEPWIEGGDEEGVSREKWKETWNKYGNIGNVDIAANLVELYEEGQIPKDSIIALFPPGGGGHTPCMIIKWLV